LNRIKKYFALAAKVAQLGDSKEANRQYRIGSVGVRKDGVIVCSSNVSIRTPNKDAHAEARLAKKLTPQSVVFVVRIDRAGDFKMAKPCEACAKKLRLSKIRKCYYTINNSEYGVIEYD